MNEPSKPSVLILGSKYDFSCDYVVSKLHSRGVSYVRLNEEDISSWSFDWDPRARKFKGSRLDFEFRLCPGQLTGVFTRRPTFWRSSSRNKSPKENLIRTHWATFLRSLMMYDDCTWINYPPATYRAEHKPLQLALAAEQGFKVPETRITNTSDSVADFDNLEKVALKGVDTVRWKENKQEHFGYTIFTRNKELKKEDLSLMPVVVQEVLEEKQDLRVTVVGDKIWTAAILSNGSGVEGDWRLRKEEVEYTPLSLPHKVKSLCIDFVDELGLVYGAIDLARVEEKFFFLEINPIGEWAWLEDRLDFPISEAISTELHRPVQETP